MLHEPLTERARFLEHRGRRILLIDYSAIDSTETALRVIERSREMVSGEPLGSVLTLTHVRDARFDRQVVSALLAATKHNKPYVRAAAVVGMQPLHRVVLDTIQLFSQRKMEAFDDPEAAKEWLAAQP